MELTKEQLAIINSTGDIKINAVAGSGKTTTVIEYAKTRPSTSRILYLAFNKSVRLEAAKKFAEKGLHHVTVETAHSLAYRHIVFRHGYKVRAQGYKTNEIVELLKLQGNGEKHTEYILANHVNKLIANFCNSDKLKVKDIDYLQTVNDPKAKSFVASYYDYIVTQARLLLSKMDKGEIEITHDFYLKKFQLSKPVLHFDYILFDEGQDASPAMLDVFLQQQAIKVIVGDTHQQIYGWRFAVNSLEKVAFTTFHLSASFRFSQDIANLAMAVLDFKNHIKEHQSISIKGKGKSKANKTKAVIARTNLGLLLNAIEHITEKKAAKRIYFEGNFNSYTYADEGASLYDVLNLFNGNRYLIKDNLIKAMKDLDELEDYIEKTEDAQLSMMLDIVKEYGSRIPALIKEIKDKHVEHDEKEKADIIFTTVHRCKGMEYDDIELVNDFMTEEKLVKQMEEIGNDDLGMSKLNEEINLLYVAVTRTRNSIRIPSTLMPTEFPSSSHILVTKIYSKEEKEAQRKANWAQKMDRNKTKTEKAYTVDDVRTKHADAYQPWTAKLDDELTTLYCDGVSMQVMVKHFGRTSGAIRSRIKKLALEELYG